MMNKEEFKKIAIERYGYSEKDADEIIKVVEELKKRGIVNEPYEDYLIDIVTD